MAANRPADAALAYQEALNAAPSEMLVGRLNGALRSSGQTDASIKALTDWTAQRPNDTVAKEQLADIFIATKRLDQAVTLLQQILEKKPHDFDHHSTGSGVAELHRCQPADCADDKIRLAGPDGLESAPASALRLLHAGRTV